jgi:hypothetical protein
MPVFLVAAWQIVIAFIASLATFLTWAGATFLLFATRKYLIYAASVVAAIALYVAFYAAMQALLGTMSSWLAPPSWVVGPMRQIAPAHMSNFISILATAYLAKFVIRFAIKKLTWLNGGS